MASDPNLHLLTHPLIQQRLTIARDRNTGVEAFRRQVSLIARLMVYELTRDYPTVDVEVQTPVGACRGKKLAVNLTLVPILRAGLGMAEGILELIPEARVGHLGLYRNEQTLEPVTYYNKLPPDIAETDVIVIDPMLATGGSLSTAVDYVARVGARRIKILCLVASPEGIAVVRRDHPTMPIYTAAVDECLNERGYIVPGLGDAGDRLFGTA
ncbi:MAG: uracil phosphoribosyltransferase [Phycisphaerales bacterium]|nr:uracil phosphoribosyltransferase [Phycisphaerales bacterium]